MAILGPQCRNLVSTHVFTVCKYLLLADGGRQVDGFGAAVNPLHRRCAVARSVVRSAVEYLAARPGAQTVAVRGEWVAKLSAELVLDDVS